MNKIYLTIFVTLLLTTSLALAMTIEQTLTATVVIIENQTQTPCVFENQDVNLYIDIDSGGIDLTNQVIFSYTINEITKNKTAQLKPGTQNTYFYTISSSELIGGENVTWKVYLNSIETNENSFYIRKNTILEINPQQPDGKNNWYITEPEFTLIHDNNPLAQVINTYYYWNGLGQIQYTNPFGLDDISNQPKESAGTLKLTYWSEYQCATEEINYKWLYIDLTPPQFKDHLPAPNSINKQNKTTIQAYISEIYGSNSGINLSSIQMKINGQPVQLNTYPHQELNAIVNYSAELPDAIYQIEISAKDYAGNSNTTSWTFEIDSKLPSYELKINSPQEKIYNNRRINFDIETETPADEIMYADLSRPRIIYRRLCRNCNSFKRDFFFRDANNSLSFRSIKDGEIVSEKNISFFVDSTSPRITRIMPIRGFTNGSFQVQFREQNPKNLTLFYANTHKNFEVDLEKCTFQRNTYTCNLNVDLSDYENQEITYWFELTDIAENKDASRKYSILVDTTPPEIQIEYEITRGLIELEIKVKEENFDRITYINTKDPRQIERLLCTRLFDSVCKTRISLRDANHSLIIIAKDKAGNQFQDNKTFENIFIDTRPPRITQTEPRIGYTNSTFQIQFVEENTKEVTLYYSNNTGQKTKKLNLQENCKFNRINLCSIDANLTELENQQIEYYFKVKDIVNNTATSRKTKLTVDIQPPIIQDSSYVQQIGFRRVEFFLNLTEKNFKEAYYINLNDPLQTKRRLCTRLNAQNICKVTRFFSYGENNILIIIKDKAENTASLQENLFIT